MSKVSSPLISIEQYTSKPRLSELRVNNKYVFWLDADLDNKCRQFLNIYIPDLPNNNLFKLTDASLFNIKTSINEYGGASYWLSDSSLFFYNKDDCAVYVINLALLSNIFNTKEFNILSSEQQQKYIFNKLKIDFLDSTKPDSDKMIYNYSDGIVTGQNFIAVREVSKSNTEVYQELIYFDSTKKQLFILDQEHDFYSYPRFNRNTNQLIWLSRQHPNMPWDHNELYCANLDNINISLLNKRKLIDIPDNSFYQPEWYDDEHILIVSEHNKSKPFWNLYRFNINNEKFINLINGEFEMALPMWQLGSNSYCFTHNRQSSSNNRLNLNIFYYRIFNGKYDLYQSSLKNISDNQNIIHNKLDSPVVYIQDNLFKFNNSLYYIAATEDMDLAVYQHNIDTHQVNGKYPLNIQRNETISHAELLQFTNNLGQESYAYFYRPINTIRFDSKPPLIVMCHSGPTSTTNMGYSNKIQFWTSRGYAVVDVNYGGSTSCGRSYRERLKHNWGIVDVADCAAAAEYLVNTDIVDKNQVIIRGTSAGGFTVLTALYKYDIFSAGCCHYPMSDLTDFNNTSHNFEKYYNNFLIGDYEDNYDEYVNRSPINFAEFITKPVLIIHGTQDNVIPIEQSRKLFNKLKNNNKLNKFVELAGEGHGFRCYSTVKKAIEHELMFYNKLS